MQYYSYSISPDIFARFPGYVRGVVIAHDVKNGASPAEVVQMLREAEASVRARIDPEQVEVLLAKLGAGLNIFLGKDRSATVIAEVRAALAAEGK